jgi:type VI secretion system protein VasD
MRIRRCQRFQRILFAASALVLLSCYYKPKTKETPPPPPPPQPTAVQLPPKLELNIVAASTINRDLEGNPLSVVVHLFMLKDKQEFSKLTFDAVSSSRSEAELLGTDLIGKMAEIVVLPGSTYTDPEDLPAGTKYVGIVALFRKPDPNYWRYLVSVDSLRPAMPPPPVKKDKNTKPAPLPNPKLSFKIEDCYLALSGIKAEPIPGQPENAKPDCGNRPASLVTTSPNTSVPTTTTPSPVNRPTEYPKPKISTPKKGG